MTIEQSENEYVEQEPLKFEVVIYIDGTSSVSEYLRRVDGMVEYVGRKFLDEEQTGRLVWAIRHPQRIVMPQDAQGGER